MAKTSKPMIRIHNTETNEIIDREMTDDEYTVYLEKITKMQSQQAEAEAKEIAKAAILDRLGLTADELKTILG
jgi:hypothetical protein